MSDDIKNASAGAPPKLILRRPAAGAPPAPDTPTVKDVRPPTAKKQTTRLDLSAAVDPAVASAKKQTSRIPLETAAPPKPENIPPATGILESAPLDSSALQTIKIKRPAQAQAPKLSQPIELLLNRQSTSLSEVERISLKKQTSRISLESALAPDESAPEPVAAGVPAPSSAPSTIKIKRPGKTVEGPPIEPPADTGSTLSEQPTLVKSQTSKIEIGPPAAPATESEGQPTQRKTIKIRRPDGSPSPTVQRTVARAPVRISKDGAPALTSIGGMEMAPPPAPREDVPLSPRQKVLRLVGNIVFSAVASIAVIVSGIVLYVLSLQKYDW